jgi:hypothetical protein
MHNKHSKQRNRFVCFLCGSEHATEAPLVNHLGKHVSRKLWKPDYDEHVRLYRAQALAPDRMVKSALKFIAEASAARLHEASERADVVACRTSRLIERIARAEQFLHMQAQSQGEVSWKRCCLVPPAGSLEGAVCAGHSCVISDRSVRPAADFEVSIGRVRRKKTHRCAGPSAAV